MNIYLVRKNLNYILFIALLLFYSGKFASGQELLPPDSVTKELIRQMQQSNSDSVRKAANSIFRDILGKAILMDGSFSHGFDSLKNLLIRNSPDNKIRLYTWVIAQTDGNQFNYFGYLQYKTKSGAFKVVSLYDSTESIKKTELERLKPEKWFGATYYEIIPVKRGKKTYYTLLGWKGKDRRITQKVIDVLHFDNDNPRFGFPLFKTDNVYKNRVIFSYTSQASMSLRYEKNMRMIVFDHLSAPGKSAAEGSMEQLMGPDGSYDGFRFKSSRWVYQRDVDVRSDWKPGRTNLQTPSQR
ncbi:MAG: hypothetical protein DWQ44_06955 [Bacteroidetes bacterium]|nr:MAG: hypothetical protein DWQ33_12735 [Bacteroidota bacterium]REJ99754.1 MAG: hypothetical protein DWQ39_12575 [Bacteroidota bacterium]REK34127.1 MAG: hypothetical protein DWQ44_06955 [Bacteroidota bacterium]REK50458.1 MAG: hypothetical protein DWQ48_03865 [Bacteroidota bacterium]